MVMLDYGNAPYFGLSNKEPLGINRNGILTLARYQLHWLPVDEMMRFIILTLLNKCLNDKVLLYLQKSVRF